MKNKPVPVISIILYVLAGLLFVFTVYITIVSVNYITPSFDQGLTFQGYELEVINFYVSNIATTALFSIAFFALGWIIQLVTPAKEMVEEADEFEFVSEEVIVEEDEE